MKKNSVVIPLTEEQADCVVKRLGLVRFVLNRDICCPDKHLRKDLYSEGVCGLIKGVKRIQSVYNDEVVVSYLCRKIRGAMWDFMRSFVDSAPRSSRYFMNRAKKIPGFESLSDVEVAERLGVSLKRYQGFKRGITRSFVSLDSPLSEESESLKLGDILEDSEASTPGEKLLSFDDSNNLHRLIDQLSPMRREVLLLHYFNGLKFKEIAETLNLSSSRVSQIHEESLVFLRNKIRFESQLCA